jgi:hypothetical protein
MDQDRFDTLSRALASTPHRRSLLGLILGAALLGRGGQSAAAGDKGKGKGHSQSGGEGHEKGKGEGHQCDKICADLACDDVKQTPVPPGARPEFCCKGGFCSCGGKCCEGQCFQTGTEESPDNVFCCTGPKLVVCQVLRNGELEDTCCKGSCDTCDDPNTSAIAGSYRRR